MIKVYALLLLASLPFALRNPSAPLPGMVPVLAFEHRLFHPSLWFSRVEAAASVARLWSPGPEERLALDRLERGLRREANPKARERLRVRRAEGRGGASWPDLLLVERSWTDKDMAWLEGCPVVRGADLIGFVDIPTQASERRDLQDQGLLQIELLTHRGRGTARRRFAAMARSVQDKKHLEHRPIRLIVEASAPKDPYPLRSLRSSPEQIDTRSQGPYLARIVRSSELHPGLPEGLVLGWIQDEVYERDGFVQSRWLLPRWHPRGLVQVELLGGPGSRSSDSDDWSQQMRAPARVIWRSPENLGYRRYLLQGSGLQTGMAVMTGARCLGRIEWADGQVALAVPLSKRGAILPMLWWGGESRRVKAFLVEGMGSSWNADRFRVLHQEHFEAGFLEGGQLFTGTLGRVFPAGLLITDLFELEGKTLSLRDDLLRSWPADVEVVSMAGRVR